MEDGRQRVFTGVEQVDVEGMSWCWQDEAGGLQASSGAEPKAGSCTTERDPSLASGRDPRQAGEPQWCALSRATGGFSEAASRNEVQGASRESRATGAGQCCFINCHLYEYHYVKEEKTWTEAQQYCREKHTDLATVSNMTDMKRLLNNSTGDMRGAWIGLHDPPGVNRTWYWSLPGEEFNEKDAMWHSGEPNDKGNPGPENCGFLIKTYEWGDVKCSSQRYFLCYNETNTTQKYHLIRERKTWQEAQSYCREKHTDLISGLKQLQDGELKEVMDSTTSKSYFGLFRDTWRWSDGSSFSFRNWNLQFDYQIINSGQCAMTVFDDEGRWRNENCAVRKPFICYDDKVILIKETKTWEEALYYCRDHHHDLVTITNLDEQRWVQEKAKKASTDYVWMGLRYACTLDFWFWVSDEVVSYENWAPDGLMDDCDMSGAMKTGEPAHQWRKRNDADKFNFVCSKD
ncbi:C-type mannose receptor 2 [Fundulus heteroclitus]|uniref:C-type mannose receptor 2 n=1 Tax=Fundulus heteroclitus TaxID=8078 RepID=UPI00165CA28D|nr:C-type mannose receptor 2 [Fundulus heteroclitus]